MKKALITGITGQDGSYLAELLYAKGYDVHGIIRRSSSPNTYRIDHLFHDLHTTDSRIHLHFGDLADSGNLSRLVEKIQPDEIYNLGAQSHVRVSFDMPEYTARVVGLGSLALLDAARNLSPNIRFYQAGTSEMFGKVTEIPQKESTPFYPRSPYGSAKVFAHHSVVNYRESYGMFACNGILFNHESPRREASFVTRKIIRGIKEIIAGKNEKICLGNLDSKRDWGYAPEYVEAMWLMLQQETPDDYVIATGEMHSVRELVEVITEMVGIKIEWRGEGLHEVGVNSETGKVIIEVDPYYFRPSEVDILLGDASKARERLGWSPKTSFKELVRIMYDAEKV